MIYVQAILHTYRMVASRIAISEYLATDPWTSGWDKVSDVVDRLTERDVARYGRPAWQFPTGPGAGRVVGAPYRQAIGQAAEAQARSRRRACAAPFTSRTCASNISGQTSRRTAPPEAAIRCSSRSAEATEAPGSRAPLHHVRVASLPPAHNRRAESPYRRTQ